MVTLDNYDTFKAKTLSIFDELDEIVSSDLPAEEKESKFENVLSQYML